MRYYKGKYAIALYDTEEYPMYICDSVTELTRWLDKPLKQVRDAVSKHFVSGGGYFHLAHKLCTIHFINMIEDEE